MEDYTRCSTLHVHVINFAKSTCMYTYMYGAVQYVHVAKTTSRESDYQLMVQEH